VSVPKHRRAGLDEQIARRLPWVAQRFIGAVLKLPPGSSLRHWLLRWLFHRGLAAMERGDFELIMNVIYDESVELTVIGRPADFEERYQGRAATLDAYLAWCDTWADYRRELREIVDLSANEIELRVVEFGTGKGSKLPIEGRFAMRLAFEHGRIIRHHEFAGWEAP
jgi:ketosteroid isomerase-like protein